jgi:hypothetical protein
MIVQACATTPTKDYAILGDDVVVSEGLNEPYLEFMKMLGVKISLPKSIISENYVEFAKKIFSFDGTNFSVIGPGLILSCIQNKLLISMLLAESFNRGLLRTSEVLSRFSEARLSTEHTDFG